MTTAELTTQALLPKDDDSTRGRVIEALSRWHDDQRHTGTVEYCYEQPCHVLYRAADEGEDDHSDCSPLAHDCTNECDHECRRCGSEMVCPDQAAHNQKEAELRAERAKRTPDVAAK